MNFTLRHGLVPADLMWWPVVLGSTIALATFSWYVIERPALSLKSLVPRWRAPLPGVARDPA
jgi:peptidoglycan/LPS O-acetylase OafA/YrhL